MRTLCVWLAGSGTYAAMTAKLDYLTSLGINALELQPIQEFNELEYYQVRQPC